MSHTVTVRLIADQIIEVAGKERNIHEIETIYVNADGQIEDVAIKEKEPDSFYRRYKETDEEMG